MIRRVEGGVELVVRLTPRAAADRIDPPRTGADGRTYLCARVRAVPEKGAANESLTRLVAAWLGVAPSTVSLAAGATQRLKTVRIAGEAQTLHARIADLTPVGATVSRPADPR
ncbi:MAG TPA: DUF167 family protein [Mesorhizobium sp.]